MTVTFLDMAAMFGLPPNGKEVTSLLSVEDVVGLNLPEKDTAYGFFLTKCCGTNDLATET